MKRPINIEKLEYIRDMIEDLKELALEHPIIVEGKRDERALRELGIEGKIFKVQTAPSVLELCENVAGEHKEAILFTDLDSAGKRIGKNVKKYLTDKGVKVNDNIAKKLMYSLDTTETENVFKRFERAFRKINYP
jgi:5S rRNA maturation endonuclease (ribonuclease M5)